MLLQKAPWLGSILFSRSGAMKDEGESYLFLMLPLLDSVSGVLRPRRGEMICLDPEILFLFGIYLLISGIGEP